MIETGGEDKIDGMPLAVVDAFMKADSVINKPQYERIMCSVSGGADSDVMMDLLFRVDKDRKIRYVFFNTGVEYRATLEHIDYLEQRYGVQIERIAPIKSIPVCARQNGQPVISKFVSEQIESLQHGGFKWEDLPVEELTKKYPDCRISALRWWCNDYHREKYADRPGTTMFNIGRNKFLKEYIMENPPTFSVSPSCCSWAKKKPAKKYYKDNGIQLRCIGLRKQEGGVRSVAYKNCYTFNSKSGIDSYRPLFWFSNDDKQAYCERFGVIHSRCYTEYEFKRTGCAGCPYDRDMLNKLYRLEIKEPAMCKAARNIFRDAYEWTKGYSEYAELRSKGSLQLRMY